MVILRQLKLLLNFICSITYELWLPFVQLQNINIDRRDDVNQININIEFNISRAPNSLDSVQVTFDNGGDGASSSTTSDGAY